MPAHEVDARSASGATRNRRVRSALRGAPGPSSGAIFEWEAEGGVHFAGEHTSADFSGYMNGALESGQRAAAEAVRALALARRRVA